MNYEGASYIAAKLIQFVATGYLARAKEACLLLPCLDAEMSDFAQPNGVESHK